MTPALSRTADAAWRPATVIGGYAILTGTARFLVEFVRINDEAVLGLTQPQLWSLALVAAGAALLTVAARSRDVAGESRSVEHADAAGGVAVERYS